MRTADISKLITGGTKEKRFQQAKRIIKRKKIASLDVTVLADDASIGIKSVRLLIKELSLTPIQSKLKAVIIHPGDNMTVEAQNALLKILEEPPKHCLIIITVTTSEKLLPTLVSRCQIITLSLSSEGDTSRQAASLLEKIVQASTRDFLTEASRIKNKQNALDLTELLIHAVRKLILKKHDAWMEKGESKNQQMSLLTLPDKALVKMLQQIKLCQKALEANVNPKLTMEVLFLKLAAAHM